MLFDFHSYKKLALVFHNFDTAWELYLTHRQYTLIKQTKKVPEVVRQDISDEDQQRVSYRR